MRFKFRNNAFLNFLIMAALSLLACESFASGVLPESPTLIINEAQNGGSINVKNTENVPVLLYSKVVDLPDDPTPRLIVTQPVARLEPGESQRVRFVLNKAGPLQHEHIKRVWFEGVAEKTSDGGAVAMTVRQDLPVIITPKGLLHKRDMWTDLSWSATADTLTVNNTGKQVVRLSPGLNLLPGRIVLALEKSYILPGESLTVTIPAGSRLSSQQKVEFSPVTRYGFDVGLQQAVLIAH